VPLYIFVEADFPNSSGFKGGHVVVNTLDLRDRDLRRRK
jgi:hypothetical protein